MKVEVLKSFQDKHTGEIHKKGTVIPDMKKERFEEIVKADETLVKEVTEADEKPAKGKKDKKEEK